MGCRLSVNVADCPPGAGYELREVARPVYLAWAYYFICSVVRRRSPVAAFHPASCVRCSGATITPAPLSTAAKSPPSPLPAFTRSLSSVLYPLPFASQQSPIASPIFCLRFGCSSLALPLLGLPVGVDARSLL
ncbi:hypothetical protein BDW02DRAFT_34826 [Decorospora gaudefroyi]|uniref:Uncharacterized protein n=1 Tax=Decorospora gaudefroyi TaxID=184978 RepID=A0A6A5KIQ4_9PLEO|nr:hypothetical protein BDW02DRAFT_34826 [Decorospora gaudefroyi]